MDCYDFNQLLISPFENAAQTAKWKKSSTNHFDGLTTTFDEMMSRLYPFSDNAKTSTTDRKTIMSYLVDKVRAESEMLKQQIMNAKQKIEAADKPYNVMLRCLDIAFGIRNGEKVSIEDLRFLEENDPELYYGAMLKK